MSIEWKQTGSDPNDLIAHVGSDCLRVERLNKKTFWWCFYIGDAQYDCWAKGDVGKTLEGAKNICEQAYKNKVTPSNG